MPQDGTHKHAADPSPKRKRGVYKPVAPLLRIPGSCWTAARGFGYADGRRTPGVPAMTMFTCTMIATISGVSFGVEPDDPAADASRLRSPAAEVVGAGCSPGRRRR